MTKSLRTLINDPSLIEKWIEIYKSKTSSELPEVRNRIRQLDQEIQTTTKKISNLVQRVAELPSEVPADPFYEQIKLLNQKLTEAKLAKEKQKTKEMDLYGQDIDQEGTVWVRVLSEVAHHFDHKATFCPPIKSAVISNIKRPSSAD